LAVARLALPRAGTGFATRVGMLTIDSAQLANVTGGAPQAPRPVPAPPQPSPTFPSSTVGGVMSAIQPGVVQRARAQDLADEK